MKRLLLIAALIVGLLPGVSHADHESNGCPQGWDIEVAGWYTEDMWIQYDIRHSDGYEDQRWDHFEAPDWDDVWVYAFYSRLGGMDDDTRVSYVKIYTGGAHSAGVHCG